MPQTSLPTPAWRKTAILNTGFTVLLFSGFTTCLIISTLRAGSINSVFVLYEGPCDGSKWLNLSLHLLLNILSTAILASSNYFKQVLVSPTRTEIDKVHNTRGWLNIGVPSSTNWMSMSWLKIALWLLFSTTSLPIHLFFNGIIFTTHRSGISAVGTLTTPATGTCSVSSSSTLLLIATACISLKLVICVTTLLVLRGSSPLLTLGDAIESFLVSPDPNTEKLDNILEFDHKMKPRDPKSVATAKPIILDDKAVLLQDDPCCWGSVSIFAIYLVKSLPLPGTRQTRRLRFGNVLERFRSQTSTASPTLPTDDRGLLAWRSQSLNRGHAAGSRAWAMIIGSFLLAEAILVYGCYSSISSINRVKIRNSFGENLITPWLLSSHTTTKGTPTGLLVLVNTPQLLLTIIYLVYNSTLTKAAIAIEWARFGTGYRPLRVTTPRGDQTSSYFLGLPYGHAILLMGISALVHWVTSQALFVVTVDGSDGVVTVIAFSVWAIITLAVMIPILFAWLIWFLRRPLPGYMPLVGSNSMAISACCRFLPRPSNLWDEVESRQRACQRKLKWGVGKPMAVSHLDWYEYSSGEQTWLGLGTEEDEVLEPVEQQSYALGKVEGPGSGLLTPGEIRLYS